MSITDHKIVDLDGLSRYHTKLMTTLPKISDTTVTTTDTWSSNKISGELTTLKNGIATNADIQSLFGGDE